MNGKLKSSRRQAAELHFDFAVESLGEWSGGNLITKPRIGDCNMVDMVYFSVYKYACVCVFYIDGLVQERHNSSALAMELRFS